MVLWWGVGLVGEGMRESKMRKETSEDEKVKILEQIRMLKIGEIKNDWWN